ncbi:unnamed protein product [Mytilus coruscus]|uniref:DDE Tnp4 domain-containing protein n=1 Tax=Mytilus coruscus TaxID=42192 RepID=A0A6J8CM50_MYTCO|nr:unnamed protein product [Mytilus coruscus]
MSPTSVLLCLLMKLRLNLQHEDLAYRFGVSKTISDILNLGLPKLANKLSFLIQWPDKEYLLSNMPSVLNNLTEVSITPTGAISFVSKAFGGRTSDKVIKQLSGYLDKIQHGDQVLADRGFFYISKELANKSATLVIPAFTRGKKKQLSAKEVEQTRKIVHVRIHVERAIQRLKNFNILSSNMSMCMVPHSDSIVTICSAICNLQPKLVS